MKFDGNYYLGLDIGTDSVGYAVTDERYKLLKFKGEPMWGSHLFDAASLCSERRGFRTARRRLDRRQQRVALVDEIFCPEVVKEDPNFYIRKKESALYNEDKSVKGGYLFFNGNGYTDKQFYNEYPTIHHLICDLMKNKERKFDIRLINIAADWLVAHRGHFLCDVGIDNVDKVLDFKDIYDQFIEFFDEEDSYRCSPWNKVDAEQLGHILKLKGVNKKKNQLKELLFPNGIPSDDYFIDRKEFINWLAGGKVQLNKLFMESGYEDDVKASIGDDMELLLPQLNDEDAELISRTAAMHDWSILSDILAGNTFISEAKVKVFERHQTDLKQLKKFVRKYCKEKYTEIFRKSGKDLKNYVAYVYNANSNGKDIPKGKASASDFYTYLKKTLSLDKLECDCNGDEEFRRDMLERMENGNFLPKQVTTDNRVIPYQLYYVEYKIILENAARHYAFLNQKDSDGYEIIKKLKSIFTFKIPYYVGPLRHDSENDKYAWVVRKAAGKIKPWNFEEKIDLDMSEEEFIRRLTNSCTYIPGESVLPKWSLLYTKYMVLNEINNLKVNGTDIDVETKQGIFNDLFARKSKVTPKMIREYLVSRGIVNSNDLVGGIDETIKSNLKPRYEFRHLIENNTLTSEDVERIISRRTYSEDHRRYKEWLGREYPSLNEADFKYVSRLKYKEFGRFSGYFLNGLIGTNKDTGETGTIMHFLWETNDNLMQILSDRYTFFEEIARIRREYYLEHKLSFTEQLDELGISNAVKRSVTRTFAVVDDVVSAAGSAPKKIFVEMARGEDEVKKRTTSRRDQLLELYKHIKEDTKELEKILEEMGDTANNKLQSDALYLYFAQLGKCMYSGEPIDISQIKSEKYNIDHIWPQSYVKDDSLVNNKVLVLSKINGEKKDVYPIESSIRKKMQPMWKRLEESKLISKEKYERLIRSTPFTESEKMGFINRQLVETRQSTKAVTQLLKNRFPETQIVYVKSKLVSDLKNEFDFIPKSRIINDLHHAKDAYLNIVVGNVYNERFEKKWFRISEKYSVNPKSVFAHDVIHGEQIIWDSKNDLPFVKKTYEKNNIHLTRYAYCQKGGLFDQMPVKKGQGQIPLKKEMDISKYGGYNKVASSFFVVATYCRAGKKEVSFVPVDLLVSERFVSDKEFAVSYTKEYLQSINSKKIENIELPLGRIVKIKTVLMLDGYKVWINGKANGGKIVLLSNAESLKLEKNLTVYIKRLENYYEKRKNNKKLIHDEEYDHLSKYKNIELYDVLLHKLHESIFFKMPGNQYDVLLNGKEEFERMDFDSQVNALVSIVGLFKTGRAGGCDLSSIHGKSSSGAMTLGSTISSGKYNDIRIADISPAGLHEVISPNLMGL